MGPARALIWLAAGLAASSACAQRELPPLGEALVVVDTDVPVPRVASALRVDTYDGENGTWLESREIARRDSRDWPVSFSLQAADDARERTIAVRLRVHGEARQSVGDGPRLFRDGRDVTPTSEPVPALAIDRLVLVRLRPGERGRIRVVARASCAGVATRIEPGSFASCVEGEGTSERIDIAALEPDLTTPNQSFRDTAATTPCPSGSGGTPDRSCIEGGAFVLGTDDVDIAPDRDLPARPAQISRVRTFSIDVDEVTVGRFRAVIARGFVPPTEPGATEGELGTTTETTCPYSEEPRGREDFAMSCVTWETARAVCTFLGGDLPTEGQWEFVATSSARRVKTIFPWGDEPPDCGRAVFGRLDLAGYPGVCESERGEGPRALRDEAGRVSPFDVTPSGIHELGGGVMEWTRDAPMPYDAPCHRGIDASCSDLTTDLHVVRGGSWASTPIFVRSTVRAAARRPASFLGFRCVYRP